MADGVLKGQVAVVTGAAKRIGRSIALRFAEAAAHVVVNYDSSQAEAEALVEEIKAKGVNAAAVQGNVAHRDDVQKLFHAVEAQFGRLDILVNNAGMFFSAKFEELTEEQWDRIMDTNLKSQFLCSQTAAPLLKKSRSAGGSSIFRRSGDCCRGRVTRTTVYRRRDRSC